MPCLALCFFCHFIDKWEVTHYSNYDLTVVTPQSILLPKVLRAYGDYVIIPFAELAKAVGLVDENTGESIIPVNSNQEDLIA